MSFLVDEKTIVDPIWLTVRNISIGQVPLGNGTPDKFYLITKDNKTYLLVKVYYEYLSPFQSFTLWHDFLFIGMPEYVCYIDLLISEIYKFTLDKHDLYFDCFYQYSNLLFLASSNKLYCLDSKCSLVWKTEEIGIDGVVIHDFINDYLQVSG